MSRLMKFDASVNLGHVLTILAMFMGGSVAYTSIQVELTKLSLQVETVGVDQRKNRDLYEKLEDRVRQLEIRSNSRGGSQ